jgi:hypothetical protein
MAQLTIGVGTAANDGTGDTVRAAFVKANTNFTDLYRLTIQAGKAPAINGSVTITGTDATTITLPSVSATLPGLAIANVYTAAQTITSASGSAIAVGLNGATNPALVIDASTASQAAGLKITGAATGGTVAIAAVDSGAATNLTINAKGTGTIGIGSVSTGMVTITPALSCTASVTALTHTATATITGGLTAGAFSYGTLPYSATGNAASFNLSANNYSQIIVSNSSNTATASANIVVSNNAGTDTAKYGCLGINSDSFSGTACAGDLPTATYLCCSTGDLAIGTNTANAVHLFAAYSTVDAITISAGNVPSVYNANLLSAPAVNGQLFQIKSQTELLTIAAAATSTTTMQVPANTIVLGVSVYTQTGIPTATSYTVGDNGSATRYSTAAVGVAAGTSDVGTAAGAYYNATAKGIIITPNGTPAANTGRVRVTMHYLVVTAPTS